MKKLAIVGKGTAGCMNVGHFLKYTDWEIDWYFDSNIKPQPVGEGGFVGFTQQLHDLFGFTHSDLHLIDGTFKTGVKKIGFSEKPILNYFAPPAVGYHFNAVKLQEYIVNYASTNPRIKLIDKNIANEDIDSDFVIDCSGRPTNFDDYSTTSSIPVNGAYITQCYWDYPKFNETLTIARPYGWVFCVPLQNRCAVGYVYNTDINNVDDIKDDVVNVFEEYQLIPSENTGTFSWKNYFRKENFTKRIVYNGSASMFLEPMETTPLWLSTKVQQLAYDQWNNNVPVEAVNNYFLQLVSEIETIILLHYFSSNKYNTAFWKHARLSAYNHILSKAEDPKFRELLKIIDPSVPAFEIQYAMWEYWNLKLNLGNLDLYPRLNNLIND